MMTAEEKKKLYFLMDKAESSGDIEETQRIQKLIPLAPHLAKAAKEVYGADYLKNTGLNLSDAEETYGKNWLHE